VKAIEAVALLVGCVASALVIAAAVSRGLKRFVRAELAPRLRVIEDALLELLDERGPRGREIARRIRRNREAEEERAS
jgi:hypothetical protein